MRQNSSPVDTVNIFCVDTVKNQLVSSQETEVATVLICRVLDMYEGNGDPNFPTQFHVVVKGIFAKITINFRVLSKKYPFRLQTNVVADSFEVFDEDLHNSNNEGE